MSALSLLLFVTIGAVGIAIGTTIAGWLQVAMLAGTLHARGDFALDDTFRRRFPRMLAASLVMGVVVFGLTNCSAHGSRRGTCSSCKSAPSPLLVGGGLLAYLPTAEAFGAMEIRPLLRRLLRR